MTPKTLPALPPIPTFIPKYVLDEVKSRGYVYVGTGKEGGLFKDLYIEGCAARTASDGKVVSFSHGTWQGGGPNMHYFVTPEAAAKYFTPPKKTPTFTRGAKGRFVSKNPAPAKREEGRRPVQGEIWRSDYGLDFLVARVSPDAAMLISVDGGANRKNERDLKFDSKSSIVNDQNLTFVAHSLAEYFSKKA